MTAPTMVDPSANLLDWQKNDQAIVNKQLQQQQMDVISPAANSLSTQPYYDTLNTIRQNSISATQGAITADAQTQAREDALKQQEFDRLHGNAVGGAYDSAQAYYQSDPSCGMGMGGAGWGSGGAQGIANVLRQAGFAEKDIPTFMAIAMAESGGRPDAVNNRNSNGSIDRGLFQINSVHQGNPWYPQNPFDPLQSAKAALAIYQSQGLKAWSVYNSGAYQKFIPSSVPAAQNFSVGAQSFASGGTAKSFNGTPTTPTRAQALNMSLQVLKIPYVWGGNSLQTGVDCSGLVQQVYKQFGISMPRTSAQQATTGVRVGSYNQLQPGDLVAFKWAGGWAGPNTVSHIAIYAGNGEIIEAAGGNAGDRRKLGNSAQDRGAIYIHTRFPGE